MLTRIEENVTYRSRTAAVYSRAAALFLLFTLPSMAGHQDLRIVCQDMSPWPGCCTATSDSAGSGAQYLWSASPGAMNPAITEVNWTAKDSGRMEEQIACRRVSSDVEFNT